MYKNIEKQKVLHMAEQVDYQDGQIISRTLVQNSKLSMTLFAFEKDEEISTHAAGGDAMVTVLEGTGRFTVGSASITLTGLAIAAQAGVILNAVLPGNDYRFGHRSRGRQVRRPGLLLRNRKSANPVSV